MMTTIESLASKSDLTAYILYIVCPHYEDILIVPSIGSTTLSEMIYI